MAFKLNMSELVKAPVNLKVVSANGTNMTHAVYLDFKRVSRADLDAYKPPVIEGGEELSSVEALDRDTVWLMTFVKGWYEVSGPDGELEFNRENFSQLLSQVPGAAVAIWDVFNQITTGELRKNA